MLLRIQVSRTKIAPMIKFNDEKKKRLIELGSSFIVTRSMALASCATLPIKSPDVDWKEIENVVGIRDVKRNTPLGILLTKAPKPESFFLETAWEDNGSGGAHDGDLTLFEKERENQFKFTRMKPTEVKKQYPAWHSYHHGEKDFLK